MRLFDYFDSDVANVSLSRKEIVVDEVVKSAVDRSTVERKQRI